jgi:predicted lysophospholipase L1 biosynthesis ABC-type transport system permease subunit
VVVPSTGVIIMEIMVPMPLSVMVGAVLGAAVEAFLVRALMPSLDPIMEPFVPRVVAGMPVIILMSEAGCRRTAQNQDGSRQ